MSTTTLTTKETSCSPRGCGENAERYLRPAYDVERGETEHVLRVFVPGCRKKNVDLSLHDGVLEIVAGRSIKTPESWEPVRREIDTVTPFRLRLRVETAYDEAAISATVSSGVLTVTLPVRPDPEPRTIAVG